MELDLRECLLCSPLFNQLTSDTFEELFAALEHIRIARGETLFEQGDEGDAFYFLATGRLKVVKKQQTVGQMLPGESFGELALISDQPRAATIIAARDCELARLPKSQFQQIITKHPKLAVELLKIMGSRLNQQQEQQEHKCQIITFVLLNQNDETLNLPSQVVSTLRQKHRAEHLSLKQLDSKLWQGASESVSSTGATHHDGLTRWLSQHEEHFDYIILETNQINSIWREFCLRQADIVLYLVNAQDGTQLLTEQLNSASHANSEKELCILHQSSSKVPTNTNRWLQHSSINKHHHLRMDSKTDVERLCRELTGTAIALVLGGGGGRSFAQIGVIKAMLELGIPIDRVAGTSMGAIIAAQYAHGLSPEQLLDVNNDIWVKNKPHRNFSLPVTSLLKADKAVRLTKEVFFNREISDLWLDFFCISTDLTNLKAHQHNDGLIWPAILASGAVPSVCSSIVSDDGALLVDGGILDNLPVEAMRKRHKGPIIAVDVSSDRGLAPRVTDTIPPNGWRALLDYINPWAKHRRYPHLFKIITHTATLASKINADESRQLADLCIVPDCGDHSLMEMSNLEYLMEQGYKAALPELRQFSQQI